MALKSLQKYDKYLIYGGIALLIIGFFVPRKEGYKSGFDVVTTEDMDTIPNDLYYNYVDDNYITLFGLVLLVLGLILKYAP